MYILMKPTANAQCESSRPKRKSENSQQFYFQTCSMYDLHTLKPVLPQCWFSIVRMGICFLVGNNHSTNTRRTHWLFLNFLWKRSWWHDDLYGLFTNEKFQIKKWAIPKRMFQFEREHKVNLCLSPKIYIHLNKYEKKKNSKHMPNS